MELEHSPVISLPRCVWKDSPVEGTTCFKHDYAAVVYLVIKSPMGLTVRFLVSKTRVPPLKHQTIHRLRPLELLSALLLARLMSTVVMSQESEMQLDELICYTGSRVALYWILGTDCVYMETVFPTQSS